MVDELKKVTAVFLELLDLQLVGTGGHGSQRVGQRDKTSQRIKTWNQRREVLPFLTAFDPSAFQGRREAGQDQRGFSATGRAENRQTPIVFELRQ